MTSIQPIPVSKQPDSKRTAQRIGWLGPILLATVIILPALPLSALLWVATLDWQDPIAALPRPAGSGTVERLFETTDNGRIVTDWQLMDEAVGKVTFVVDRPQPPDTGLSAAGNTPVPTIILLGGAPKGRQALAFMPAVGENAVVSLDWPMPIPDEMPRSWGLLPEAPALRRDILSAPGQIAAVYDWLSAQDWVDRDRISLVGVSLGAMIAPSAQFLIEEASAADKPLAASLLAFGGVDIPAMIEANPALGNSPWLRDNPSRLAWLGWLAGKMLAPIEPAHYLPRLNGQFLVVTASRDGVIPKASAERMIALTPEPKDMVAITGGHIGPDPETPRILRTLSGIATGWMLGLDVVNPP